MHKLLEFSIDNIKHDIWIMVLNLHFEEEQLWYLTFLRYVLDDTILNNDVSHR